MAKHKKHDKIVKDYDRQKSEHLDKLATKMLKNDEKMQKLREKKINPNLFNLFYGLRSPACFNPFQVLT